MSFFQNVFGQEYQGYFNTGNDRQYSLTFKIPANRNNQDYHFAWNPAPFDFSTNNTLTINYCWDTEFKNWSALQINIAGVNPNATTAYEVVSFLNSNVTFSDMFEARVVQQNSKDHVLIISKKSRIKQIVKMYISNTSAEKVMRFNKKAGVGEILSYFQRDTIDNRFNYPNSMCNLVMLDPNDAYDAQIISEAGFDPDNPKEDWQLLRGRAAGIYTFKKQSLDSQGRITEIIEYPAGASAGDQARKIIYTYTDTNTTPDEIFEIPYVLTSSDLITPPVTTGDSLVPGSLWGWGKNSNGQLGDETVEDKSSPVQTICGGTNWLRIACGYYTSIGVKTDGTLWSWGDNNHGSIGDDTTDNKSSPVQTISGGTDWAKIASGCYWDHNFAIKTDGTLWGWGYNSNGELGCGDTDDRSSPIQTIAGGTNWATVSSGGKHTSAIKSDGSLWVWGENDYGQLGDETSSSYSSPIQTICGGFNWEKVACGEAFMAAIKTDGTLWTWGANGYGQLGLNDGDDRSSPIQVFVGGTDWKNISCGNNHMAGIKNDGTLWLWGQNDDGQLGTNDNNDVSSPVQTICGGSDWKYISCGQNNTAAIKNDGTLWVWGYDGNGELGDEDTSSKSSPVQTVMGGNNWVYVWSGYVNTFGIYKP